MARAAEAAAPKDYFVIRISVHALIGLIILGYGILPTILIALLFIKAEYLLIAIAFASQMLQLPVIAVFYSMFSR